MPKSVIAIAEMGDRDAEISDRHPAKRVIAMGRNPQEQEFYLPAAEAERRVPQLLD